MNKQPTKLYIQDRWLSIQNGEPATSYDVAWSHGFIHDGEKIHKADDADDPLLFRMGVEEIDLIHQGKSVVVKVDEFGIPDLSNLR